MKRTACLLLCSAALLFNACKKSTTSTPTTPPVTTPTNPYYFKFAMDTTHYSFAFPIPEYMYFNTSDAGGYQEANGNFYPSIGLRLSRPYYDTMKESDVMNLKGKTLYFSDTTIQPQLEFDSVITSTGSATWYSVDTANTNYNVKITNVVFLKSDTVLGYPVRTYVLTGTCSAIMNCGNRYATLSGGTFNYIISRRDY